MWRRSRFQENQDSDQSILDEDDFDDDYVENSVSLKRRRNTREGGLKLQSRLELLKAKYDDNRSYNQAHSSVCLEEDVEVPDSPDQGDYFSSRKICTRVSSEEPISDGEENVMQSKFSIASGTGRFDHSYGIGEQDGGNVWSLLKKEAEGLIHLEKKVSGCSSASTCSKAEKSCKGPNSKIRPRFSFGFQRLKGVSWPDIPSDVNDLLTKVGEVPERLKTNNHQNIGHSIPKVIEYFHGKEENQLEIVPLDLQACGHGFIEHSMAELLDDLQDNTSMLRGNSKMHSRGSGKKVRAALKRSICSLDDRTIESKDLHEPADYRNLELAIPEMKKQTNFDKFQEALGATSMSDEGAFVARPKAFSIGLSGKLQQLMQREKEIDMHFLKKLQNGAGLKDESSCLTVKIVSKYLDAKLTVCYCCFILTVEGFLQPDSPKVLKADELKGTVIFNQRICINVDLDIGNLICIHPPWKEVDVMGHGEKILLSTYFSEISV